MYVSLDKNVVFDQPMTIIFILFRSIAFNPLHVYMSKQILEISSRILNNGELLLL